MKDVEAAPVRGRRRFLSYASVGIAAGAASFGLARRDRARAVEGARYHGPPRWYGYRFTGQEVMDAQVLYLLGLAPSGLTDIGEVLDTASRVRFGDEVSWFEAWRATAARLIDEGRRAASRGHLRSAGQYWLRAGAYLRAGLMRYAKREDPRIAEDTRETLALHGRALGHLGYDTYEVRIPYEASVLHGRAHFAPGVDRAPVLLLQQGLHAWPEDTMWVVDGALARGIHVLSFHGPGQGASLRLHGHPFRPDWEHVVSAVVDFALGLPRFDASQVVLMGLSFGGYLAPRAAAEEHRLRALIADPGVLDWSAAMLRHYRAIPGIMPLHASGPGAFDGAIAATRAFMPDADWYFEDATWKHGVETPHALIADIQRYGDVGQAGRIRCPTLVLDGTAEDVSPDEAGRLHAGLRCDKTLMRFGPETAAQTHCQGGATLYAQTRIFDWLQETLA